MVDLWIPDIPVAIGATVGVGVGLVEIGVRVKDQSLVRAGVRIARIGGLWGWGIAGL
jgi:hypothetical protein